MRFFKSGAPNMDALATIPIPNETLPPDPHGFVEQHGPRLLANADSWREIAGKVRDYPEAYHDVIKQGLVDVWEANLHKPLPDDTILEQTTQRFGRQLSVYSLAAARHFSTELGLRTGHQIKEHFLSIPDHTANYIIRSRDFPTTTFLTRHNWLVHKIGNADINTQPILRSLAQTDLQRPGTIQALSELLADGAADVDPRFHELQEEITADWHMPRSERSVLRGFCDSLAQRRDVFAASFANLVSRDEELTSPLAAVRNMAHFAIVAEGGLTPVTADHIRAKLIKSASSWEHVPAVESVFQAFMNGRAKELSEHLDAIAGSRNPRNIRTVPTDEEIERQRNNLTVLHAPDRSARRAAKRQDARTFKSDRLPSYEEIEALSQAKPEGQATKKIVTARSTGQGSTELVPTDAAQLIEQFKLVGRRGMQEDALRMIEWLQKNPLSVASLKMNSGTARLRIEQKQLRLWRFAPEDAAGLSIHPDNRYTRIVYGITKEYVVIVDVLDHDAFDKKYK